MAYFRGAIEQLLPRSTSMLDAAGVPVPIDRERIEKIAGEMAVEGLRVLAVGRLASLSGGSLDHKQIERDDCELQFVGLFGMIDPPRPKAISSVKARSASSRRVQRLKTPY